MENHIWLIYLGMPIYVLFYEYLHVPTLKLNIIDEIDENAMVDYVQ